MAYPYDDPSGGKIAYYGQREQAPALAKARRGLQFGLSTYSPYNNPAERDARARELLAGYGEALGSIQLAGTRAGQSLWGQEQSLAAAEGDRAENRRRWEEEMAFRRKAIEPPTGGLQSMGSVGTPAPYMASLSTQMSPALSPARTDMYTQTQSPRMATGYLPQGLRSRDFQTQPQPATTAAPFVPSMPTYSAESNRIWDQPASWEKSYGTTVSYGAGSESAYRQAMNEGWQSGKGRTY